MKVKARFLGSLRTYTGKELIELESRKPLSIEEILRRIIRKKPKLRNAIDISKPERARTSVLILVNGKEISVLNGLETIIKEPDELVFVPVIHGG